MYKITLTSLILFIQISLFAQVKKISWGDEVKYGYNVNTTGNGFDFCGHYKDYYFVADNNNGESTVRTYDIYGKLKNTIQIKHEEKDNFITITSSLKTKNGFYLLVKSINKSNEISLNYLNVNENGIVNPKINKIFDNYVMTNGIKTKKYTYHFNSLWTAGILPHEDSIHHTILYYTINQVNNNKLDTVLNGIVINQNMEIVNNISPIGTSFFDHKEFKNGRIINDDTIISATAYYPKKAYKYRSVEGVTYRLLNENSKDDKTSVNKETYNFHFTDTIFKQLGIDLNNSEKYGLINYSTNFRYSYNEKALYVFFEVLNYDYNESTVYISKDSTGKKYTEKNPSNFSKNITKSNAGQIIICKIDITNNKILYSNIVDRELTISSYYLDYYYYPFVYKDNLYLIYGRDKLKTDNTDNNKFTTVIEKFDSKGKSISKEILKDGKITPSYCEQIYDDKILLTSRNKTNLTFGLLQIK